MNDNTLEAILLVTLALVPLSLLAAIALSVAWV